MQHHVHALEFAALAHAVGHEARIRGLLVPAFRTPPRSANRIRTVQRLDGASVVAIATTGRSAWSVQADMIDGILCVNDLPDGAKSNMRRLLRRALAMSSPCAA